MDQWNLNFTSKSVSTLEDLSALPAASYLCNLVDIKTTIENFMDKQYPVWRAKTINEQHHILLQRLYLPRLFKDMSEVFLQELSQQGLPQALQPNVLDKALKIAERIHDWMLHLMWDLELDGKYIQKVYLTTYGEIDEDKIFKSLWMGFCLDKPLKRSPFDERFKMLHHLACMFFQEEFIINNQTQIINEINSIIPWEINNNAVFSIMKFMIRAYDITVKWTKFNIKADLISLSTSKLLDICLFLGFYKPFIYFWNQMDESEKFIFLQKVSSASLWFDPLWYSLRTNYISENIFKILTYLIDQMDTFQRDASILFFFNNISFNFKGSKCSQKLCTCFIDKFLLILSEHGIEENFLHQVFNIFEISLFNSVINHENYKNKRDYVINAGRNKYYTLILRDDFKSLNEFMDHFLKTEHEKNHFKKKYNFLQVWISNKKWVVLDNVLNWMRTLSATDKKNIIDEVMKYLPAMGELESLKVIRKLLKWYSATDIEPLVNNKEDKLSLRDEL